LSYTYAGYGKPEQNGGEYDITFSGLSSDCYDIKYPSKKFTILGTNISSETVTVKAGTAFADKTYKGAAYTAADLTGLVLVYGTKELVQGTDFTIATGTGDWKNVGSPKYTVNFKGNYSGTKTDFASFNIVAAPITVSIEDHEITYDGNDHASTNYASAVTFNYMGLVGEDVANYATITTAWTKPTSVTVGSTAKDAKDYELTITGGAASGNYTFKNYLKGKLTIKPIELSIFAKPETKSVGQKDPTFVLSTDAPTGILTGYKVSGVTFTRTAGEAVGSYDITPDCTNAKVKKGSTDDTKNYTFKIGTPKAQLTIGKGAITVTFKNASKFYGQADPTFDNNSYVVDGLQEGDELGAFTITRDKANTAAGEAVGFYTISATIANPNAEKYTSLTVVPGALEIKKAQLTVTIPTQNLAKGKTAADLSKTGITATGINNSDVFADLYDLAFGAGVSVDGDKKTNTDETVPAGIVVTLKTDAQAKYEIIGDNKADLDIDGKYESATGKLIVGTGTAVTIAFTTATDDADYNLIKTHAGETQDVTLTLNNRVTREVPAGTAHAWAAETWNTMVLPFEVTVAELSSQLGYAIVNRVDVSKTTENNVQFKLEMQKIPANEPFCVKTSAAIEDGKMLYFNDKKIVDAGENPSVDAGMGYKFVGAYKNLTIDKNHPTYQFLRGDNAKWAHIGATSANTWTVVPFDAYVDLSAASAPEMVTFTFQELDGSFTAIKNVEANITEGATVKTGWYTIDGKKLNAAPAQKGIYILNGKKYVVK